jgi:hypothetical protein
VARFVRRNAALQSRTRLDDRVPVLTGRGDFAQGGREPSASVGEKNADFALHVSPGGSSSRVAFSAGVTLRSNTLTSLDSVITDTTSGSNATAPKVTAANRFSSSTTNKSVFGSAEFRLQDYGKLTVAARNEWPRCFLQDTTRSCIRLSSGARLKRALGVAESGTVSGARFVLVPRAGNDLAAYALQTLYRQSEF